MNKIIPSNKQNNKKVINKNKIKVQIMTTLN